MRPRPWSPPIPLTDAKRALIRRLKRKRRFLVLLREVCQELLTDGFRVELAELYKDAARGQPPVSPGRLALATLLQAYTGMSDTDVIDATVADRRWQMVLDCWESAASPFEQGTLVHFRQRLVAANLDRRLIERVLELAEARGGLGRTQLRLALDSSPLWGASRVEDTVNLLGKALRQAAAALGVPVMSGASLKGTLDLDWTDPAAHEQALGAVLAVLEHLEQTVTVGPDLPVPVTAHLTAARQVVVQDVQRDPQGRPSLRRGVAADRRISIADADQRHGHKSKAVRFDGYKRHSIRDLSQAGLIRAVAVTPANRPDTEATTAVEVDLAAQ
jgi:hypothetical protein